MYSSKLSLHGKWLIILVLFEELDRDWDPGRCRNDAARARFDQARDGLVNKASFRAPARENAASLERHLSWAGKTRHLPAERWSVLCELLREIDLEWDDSQVESCSTDAAVFRERLREAAGLLLFAA